LKKTLKFSTKKLLKRVIFAIKRVQKSDFMKKQKLEKKNIQVNIPQ
jgi:hypothetical protein